MITALLLGTVITAQQAAAPKTFEFAATNLKFNHPANWSVKKVKGDYQFTIPLPNGETGQLNLFAVSFMAEPEVWESAQKYFAEQQKLRILESSRAEILGVPMLLFRLQETATPKRKITLSGLLYAATEFKMQFRLSAPESVYPDLDFQWQELLQSVGTIDGRLPEPERKGRATEAPAAKPKPLVVPDRSLTRLGSGDDPQKPKVEQVRAKVTTGGKDVELAVPKEWTLTAVEGGLDAKSDVFGSGAVSFKVVYRPETVTANRALADLAGTSLAKFTQVAKRTEKLPDLNLVGAKVASIVREGQGENGPLTIILAVGEKGDFYWVLQVQIDGKPTKAQLAAIDALIAGASVESGP